MNETLIVNGFQAAGVAAGLKKNGKKDLGLIFSTVPAAAAGVFTRNRIQAAPVVLDRKRIESGTGRAIVVNSGNANCCTGEQGIQNALAMAKAVADGLDLSGEQVLVASTGVIGEQLPIQKIKTAVPALLGALKPEGLFDLAEAIMTTDTVPKVVAVKSQLDGKGFHLAAVAKGAGMIRPDMATMLCFVISDIELPATVMQTMLKAAVDRSFNRITVDGDMSTNDTVIFMANGASGVAAETREAHQVVQSVLDDATAATGATLCQGRRRRHQIGRSAGKRGGFRPRCPQRGRYGGELQSGENRPVRPGRQLGQNTGGGRPGGCTDRSGPGGYLL